jgi:hypothetical protein
MDYETFYRRPIDGLETFWQEQANRIRRITYS